MLGVAAILSFRLDRRLTDDAAEGVYDLCGSPQPLTRLHGSMASDRGSLNPRSCGPIRRDLPSGCSPMGGHPQKLAASLSSLSSWACSSPALLSASAALVVLAVTVLALQLRLELHVLGHDRDLRPTLPLGARPPVLLQPADHPHAPALLQVLPADLGQARPGGDLEERDLLLRLLVLLEVPVGRERRSRRPPPPSGCTSARGRAPGCPRSGRN